MIKRTPGGQYRLYTSDGTRPLSKKPQTLAEAQKQETAINLSKARAAGVRIPRKP